MSLIDPRAVLTASLTEVGCVREVNEDSCGEFQDSHGRRLLVVADGMGGHKGGATASRVAVETVGEVFQSSQTDPEKTLFAAVEAANARVYELSRDNAELRGMGTTAVMLLLGESGTAWVAHVGDSRGYRMRDGQIQPITADHSVVGEMVRQGLLSEADAAVHPRRNEILRSVGVEPTVQPDVARLDLAEGDRFLLCSDGLSGLLQDPEICAVVLREPPQQAARTLIDTANQRGAPDNVTVQIAAIPGGQSTEVTGAPLFSSSVMPADIVEENRERKVKIIAGATAVVAGLLAIAMIWMAFGGEIGSAGASRSKAPNSAPVAR